MPATDFILLLNALVQLASSLLRLYFNFRKAIMMAIWRRRLLSSLRQRRG